MAAVECCSGRLLLLLVIFLVVLPDAVKGGASFRGLFTRYGDKRLSSLHSSYISNMTLDACSAACVSETTFQCKSFSYDNSRKSCYLYSVNLNDRDVHLIDLAGRDHYETNYLKKFTRLSKHKMPAGTRQSLTLTSLEECARRCLLEMLFKCRGFNFRSRDNQRKDCLLVDMTPAEGSFPAIYSDDTDFYQKELEGPLNSFINYGMGLLRPVGVSDVYGKSLRGVGVEACAQRCLDEVTFVCLSFDFIYEGEKSICHLSQYIAANVKGLVVDSHNPRHNHFEKIERYLDYFYPTLYALIPGHNLKMLSHVTPNRCARMCLEEEGFVCRSFDYQINPEGTCLLSSKTARDVGGLDTMADLQGASHHFEMKPMLDCGGNLTDSEGDLASPNWPHRYVHHEDCTWNIAVSQHKVILIKFTHFELGQQMSDHCNDDDDRLIVIDPGFRPYCILPNTKRIVTKSSEVSIQFVTNAQVDSQGFRAFYSAEWTCDVNLKQDHGEFASPKWPNSYPSGSRCSWRITAPDGNRLRVNFTSFALEQHSLGHCNDQFDHVRILDGGTIGSPLIGLYCGSHRPFSVRSSGRDIFVQFNSDNDPHTTRQGFHANYAFERLNETLIDSRFIDLAGIRKEKWEGTEQEDVAGIDEPFGAKRLASEDDSGAATAAAFDSYRSTMWTIVALLLLLVLALSVSLYLVVRHYRQKLNGQDERFIVDYEPSKFEDVPLRTVRPSKQNQQIFNNIVDLSGGVATSPMKAGGQEPSTSCAYASSDDEADECKPLPVPYPPPRTHRPLSSYGKYHDDNLKNINVESKTAV